MTFAHMTSRALALALLLPACLVDLDLGDTPATTTTDGASESTATTGSAASESPETTGSAASEGPETTGNEGAGSSGTGGESCIDQGHAAGERFPTGDKCNFCDCNADGTTSCTSRACETMQYGCTYAGQDYAFAERFPATDGCNECVCAASGLACTRRPCAMSDEGAILMESLDTPCGSDATFTAKAVLEDLPVDIEAPFLYEKDGPSYPDTTVRFRIVYDGGFIACRIPGPGQEAFDIEVLIEWMTADGSFDEGFTAYLRRDLDPGFLNGWTILGTTSPGFLNGTYEPECLSSNDFLFSAMINTDETAEGDVSKACGDILPMVGTWAYAP